MEELTGGYLFKVNDALGYMVIIAIILVFTKIFGLLFRKMKLPEVLGYIIAGLAVGPAIFGEFCGFTLIGFESAVYAGTYKAMFVIEEINGIAGGGNEVISIFSKIGVILIMFAVGLETDLKQLKNTGLASFLIALAGVAVPLLLGFVLSLAFGGIGLGTSNIFRCVFIGTILTATSVAITVSVLKEMGKVTTKLGTTIVSAAVIDDVVGIVVLSIVTSLAKTSTGSESGFEAFKGTIYGTIIMIIAFFIVAVLLGFGLSKLFNWMENKWPDTHRLPVFSLVVCFVYSWAAEEIFGVADITGAFIAGVVLATAHRSRNYIDSKVSVGSYMLFAPIFFANIGISYITFANVSGSIILFAVLAVIMGLIGKIIGCGAVAKGFKYSWRESAIAGIGMMARGEVALIVTQTVIDSATLGENALPSEFMLMTVLLILVSSILTPILLKVLYKKDLPLQNGPAHGMDESAAGDTAAEHTSAENNR